MARYWGQQKEEALTTVGGGSENLQGVSASDRKRWDGKQDQLVYDNKPMRGSVNVLNSDAIARAFEEFKDAISTAYKQYLSTQVTSYAEMVVAVTSAKNDVDNAYAAIEKYETNMRVLYEDTLSKLTDAQNIFAGATTLLNKTNTESSALSAKIKQLESAHSSVVADLDALRSALSDIEKDTDDAQVRIEELISKANDVDTQVTDLVKVVEDALAEIETEKEDTLTKIRAVRDSIPDDYEKVCEDVKEVRQELIDARKRGTWITSETLSGEMVHATDCAPVPPLNIRLYGKTEQDSTEGNQLANVVDCNSYEISGITWSSIGGAVTAKGTPTGHSYAMNYVFADLTGLIGDFFVSGNGNCIYTCVRITKGGAIAYKDAPCSITLDGTEEDVRMYFQIINDFTGVNISETIYPMLNPGNVELPWEPYTGREASPNMNYKQPLNSHGASGSIVGKVLSSNIFDLEKAKIESSWIPATTNGYKGFVVQAKPNTKYTMSAKKVSDISGVYLALANQYSSFIDEQGNPIASGADSVQWLWKNNNFDVNGNKATVTTDDTGKILLVHTSAQGNINFDFLTDIQIKEGESTDYEPYTEQPFTVLTPNGLPGIPLGTTIPDAIKNSPIHMAGVYWNNATSQYYIGDTVEYEIGKYVQRIGRYAFTGNEDFGKRGVTTFDLYQSWLEELNFGDAGVLLPMLCTHFTYDTTNTRVNTVYTMGHGYVSFSFAEYGTTTANDIKEAFAEKYAEGNPVEITYIIADPIITDLTQEELNQYNALLMNYPDTLVMNDAGAFIEVEYGKDAEAYINENYTLKSEHEALEQRVKIIEEEIIKL